MNVIWALATTTLGEAIRRKVFLIIVLVALGIMIIAPGLTALQPNHSRTVLVSLGLGIIQLCGALIAIILVMNTIPQEIERRTIYTILSKPVQRYQFILGKFFGTVMSLTIVMLAMGLTFVIVLIAQGGDSDRTLVANLSNGITANMDIMKGVLLYIVQSILLAGVAMLFSTFIAPLVNFFLSSGLYLVGNLLNPLFDSLKDSPTVSAGGKIAATLVHYILPNFANYNIQNPIIHPEHAITNEGAYMAQIITYGIIYTAILIILAIMIFDRREM